MRLSGLIGAVATAAALAWSFWSMATDAPALYVLVLTIGTFGAGIFYGKPTQALVDHPWRNRRRLRGLAQACGTRQLARLLTRIGWNRAVRRPIRGRSDLGPFREDAAGALLSHGISLVFHLVASAGLAAVGQAFWGVAALVLGFVLHAWSALLQIDVLGRVDGVQARITRA